MIKKVNLLIISICLMVLITACKQGDTVTGAPTDPFIGGTSGIVMNFEEGEPPEEISDQQVPFKATVKLVNEGEYKVVKDNILVSLAGFNPATFTAVVGDITDKKPEDDLEPKIRDSEGKIIEGTTTFASFPQGDKFFEAKELAGNTPFTIRADICYNYQTKATTPNLCILKDLVNVDELDLCEPTETKQIFNSGGPVQIANFRQAVQGTDKLNIFFDVIHKGNGNLFMPAAAPSCPMDDFRQRKLSEDRVKVTVSLRDESPLKDSLSCSLEDNGIVRLVSGKKTIRCTLDLTGKHETDFTEILNIDLDYNYRDTKETSILVTHQPSFG